MKKKIALVLSFVALFAFMTINVAEAQSPKVDTKAKVEQKSVEPCCESKGQATTQAKSGCCTAQAKAAAAAATKSSGCCSSKASTEAGEVKATQVKSGCASAGKTCGGCSSKAATQSAEQIPVPKR
jgi:hypothetical protein